MLYIDYFRLILETKLNDNNEIIFLLLFNFSLNLIIFNNINNYKLLFYFNN